ncbi:peptidase [Tepidimicrobium xylanilyticum]|nr:peptidase [Tepidimicrobium xylanilyticum]
MNIKRSICFLLSFLLILNLIGCRVKTNHIPTLVVDDLNGIDINDVDHYSIEVDFDPENKSYWAYQRVDYINNSGRELGEIYFHLYPNAFKSMETAPILFAGKSISKEYEPGFMEIEEIKIGNKRADYEIGGEGDTILRLILPKPLKAKDRIKIEFTYNVKLPINIDRFGFGEDVFNFGNWYPIACMHDDTGWNLDPYYNIGDPFYSNVSNHDVTIKVPKNIIIGTSGNIISEKIRGNTKTYVIEGKLIRDFAWVASSKFIIEETQVGDTIIRLYAMEDRPSIADYVLEVGKDSIEIFNNLFGQYPYGVYSIVMTQFPSGMEYPGIVFINRDCYTHHQEDTLERIIVHETAHQWWYGVVGNDQIDEAWLDESLATYSEVLYVHHKYGEEDGEDYFNYTCQMPYDYGEKYIDSDVVVKSLDEFNSWDDYGILVYAKGAVFLNEIKKEFGIDTLYQILERYYKTYKFKIATTKDFLNICEKVTNSPFEERAHKWLYGR